MPKYLMEELTTDGEENQVEALGHCLRVLDLDNLLGTLYEFIETYVKHSPSNEKDWPYVHYDGLVSFPDQPGNETNDSSTQVHLASFPGLQSPYAVEGLVKLLRRMTSGRRCI